MTTFNFRTTKDDKDLLDQVESFVGMAVGTRPDLGGSRISVVNEADKGTRRVTFNFVPDIKEAQRSGTRGTGRGTMRGAR